MAPRKPWEASHDGTWRVSVRKARENEDDDPVEVLTFFKAVALAGKAIKSQPKRVRKAIGKKGLAVKYWKRGVEQRPWKLPKWELVVVDLDPPGGHGGGGGELTVLAAPADKGKKKKKKPKMQVLIRGGSSHIVAKLDLYKRYDLNSLSWGNSAKAVRNLDRLIKIWRSTPENVSFSEGTLSRVFEFRATPLAWDVVRGVTLDRLFTGQNADTLVCNVCARVAEYTCDECTTGAYCGKACQAVAFHTDQHCC
jgi:hypothetical protein